MVLLSILLFETKFLLYNVNSICVALLRYSVAIYELIEPRVLLEKFPIVITLTIASHSKFVWKS